jgi:hypothetical protein
MIEDSWFYYFSSLAQTIAAGLALLVALVVIRLQNLSNSLNVIERSVAEAFYQIGKQDDYRSQASPHFLNEHWRVYFINVRRLAESNKQRFSSARDYTQSKEFLDSLIDQGCKLEAGNRRLHRALAYAFGGTLVFAGTAILVIPIAQWISSRILWFSWAVSGILLLVLFVIYFRLVFETLKPKRMEESK